MEFVNNLLNLEQKGDKVMTLLPSLLSSLLLSPIQGKTRVFMQHIECTIHCSTPIVGQNKVCHLGLGNYGFNVGNLSAFAVVIGVECCLIMNSGHSVVLIVRTVAGLIIFFLVQMQSWCSFANQTRRSILSQHSMMSVHL